jgi:competence protein ComGF
MFLIKKQNLKAFTLLEILLYLGLFLLIIAILYPLLYLTLSNYLSVRGDIDLNNEMRQIFIRIQKEIITATDINILTDWEVVFNKKDEQFGFFLSKPVYLDKSSSTVKGYANNLSVGSLSFKGDNYQVILTPSSSCQISSSTVIDSIYALSGYGWAPNIGWIKFRNDTTSEPIFGVCQEKNKQLRGYAYSDVVGWIIFNCKEINACQTSDFKVIEDKNFLYGYAWNENLGWFIFDGKGERFYFAKMNPEIYYLDLISDPRVLVKDVVFTKVDNSFKTNILLESPKGNKFDSETTIVLPFK